MKAACAGDVDSFRQLYERHYGMAVGLARSRLSDHHLAEDAAQEAFATACRRLSRLRDANRFPQWLGTICRRTASRLARSPANGKPIDEDPVAPTPDDTDRPEQVHEALNRLPAADREVIHLHYFSGLTYDEIAQVLGITPQAVHGRLQRARRKLAVRLGTSE